MNPHLDKNQKYSLSLSFVWIILAYFVALAAAVATVFLTPDLSPLWRVLLADVVATVIVWGFGTAFSNARFYDPYWSGAPPVMAIYWWYDAGAAAMDYRQMLLLLVLFYWAIRLTANWSCGWTGLKHEDWRYQDLRRGSGPVYPLVNLFGICMFPTLIVFAGMLPVYVLMTDQYPANPGWELVALVVGIGAVTVQWVSDEQMRAFRKGALGNEAVMDKGLWAWSRHPNYFGEVAMWTSLFLFALSAGGLSLAWTGIGALSMLILFLFISIPMMDKKSVAKRPAFAEHIKNSSALMMWPPKRQPE